MVQGCGHCREAELLNNGGVQGLPNVTNPSLGPVGAAAQGRQGTKWNRTGLRLGRLVPSLTPTHDFLPLQTLL